WNLTANYLVLFNTQGYASLGYVRNDVRLPFATQLIGETPLPVGKYVFNSVQGEYQTDPRKKLNLNVNFEYGQFYSGQKTSYGALIRYRQQPWGNFALRMSRDLVDLGEPYGKADLWLIGPQINVNFTDNLFWTTFLQYNTQWDNFNINSRLQWRFKPMSDVFLVYTDNYRLENFGLRNRAVVLKVNYWLTL
ncbi:MAG: hydrolase, partial [Bacteroidota bacterium]